MLNLIDGILSPEFHIYGYNKIGLYRKNVKSEQEVPLKSEYWCIYYR